MTIKNLNSLPMYRNIGYISFDILKMNLKNLLNCEVKQIVNPINFLKESYQIDLSIEYKKGSIRVKDDVILISKIYDKQKKGPFIFIHLLSGGLIKNFPDSFLNKLSQTITAIMTDSFNNYSFKNALVEIDDKFMARLLNNTLIKGNYHIANIEYFINVLRNISSLRFEGEEFTTGFILTNALKEYQHVIGQERGGTLYSLEKNFSLKTNDRFNKRIWYLVDGKTSYYLCNKWGIVNHLYIFDENKSENEIFLDAYKLNKTLMGQDLAFRVISGSQYSIINSKGQEFINIENVWRYRDYNILIKFLGEILKISEDLRDNYLNHLMFFIMHSSHNNKSSIIWIPEKESEINNSLEFKNRSSNKLISFLENQNKGSILRMLSSDGITILNKDGNVLYFGAIAKISNITEIKLSGTGETAAQMLSNNGVAIKISQDGNIKIYYHNGNKMLF